MTNAKDQTPEQALSAEAEAQADVIIQMLTYANSMPEKTAVALTNQHDSYIKQKLPLFDVAVNHCILTVLPSIAREIQAFKPPENKELEGAHTLVNLIAIREITKWAVGHPTISKEVHDVMSRISAQNWTRQADFNRRSREENVHAIQQAWENRHQTVNTDPLTKAVRPMLILIREHCLNELVKISIANQQNPNPDYAAADHFDEYNTAIWADLLTHNL